jgi:sterol desaturase/sphingolipid hydroxylase (fatty acid hydroxylase superfamily)
MEKLKDLLSIDFNYFLIGFIVLFYSLEQILSNQFKFGKRPQHLLHNLLFQVTFYVCNIFYATVTVFSIEWLNNHQFGLFYLVQVPVWVKLIVGVALFDMTTYWFHRVAHKIPLLWRFHRVHHSDTSMDASTFFRGHPIESLFWFGTSNIVASAIFGLDLMTMGLYFLVAAPLIFMEHSNLRFPKWVDKSLGLIFTTPNLHKIHHDKDQYYTDSNFADIFILWDKIFGTFKYKPVEQINFGLKEFEEGKKQTFWYLMKSPLLKVKRITSEELAKTEKS